MAKLTKADLAVQRDDERKIAKVTISGKIEFTSLEMCMMKHCHEAKHFKLNARLRAVDYGRPDEILYIWPMPALYPDASPTAHESYSFSQELGYSLLNEDPNTNPRDELIGEVILTNLYTGAVQRRLSNVVTGYF